MGDDAECYGPHHGGCNGIATWKVLLNHHHKKYDARQPTGAEPANEQFCVEFTGNADQAEPDRSIRTKVRLSTA